MSDAAALSVVVSLTLTDITHRRSIDCGHVRTLHPSDCSRLYGRLKQSLKPGGNGRCQKHASHAMLGLARYAHIFVMR